MEFQNTVEVKETYLTNFVLHFSTKLRKNSAKT